jgi:hypothetical protein
MMGKKYFPIFKIIVIAIPAALLVLAGTLCFYRINTEEYQTKENSLVHKSEFYKLMYEENDYDFIKTAEKELENIDAYIERYGECFPFYFYIKIQRDCLNGEVQKKINHLLVENGNMNAGDDCDSYLKLHPELLLSFKEKGRIIEYEEIDYIDLFRQYCIEWNSYNHYLYFCDECSVAPAEGPSGSDKHGNDSEVQNYFPKGVLSQFQNECLSSFLDFFDPVSIVSMKKGHNTIRFYCIDSGMRIGTYSYLIKVEWTRFSRSMEVVVDDSPARHKKIDISKSELKKLIRLIYECDFYNQKSTSDINANDASEYICEVNINGKYKIVSRCDMSMEPFMYKIQNSLVKKTGGAPNHGKRVWNFLRD